MSQNSAAMYPVGKMSERNRYLLVAEPIGHLDRSDIRVRNAQILRLTAGNSNRQDQMRITKQAGGSVPKASRLL